MRGLPWSRTLLTQDIESSFSAKNKAEAVFVNLTAAYDTVWHRDLICKLLHLMHDRFMIRVIMDLSATKALLYQMIAKSEAGYRTKKPVSLSVQSWARLV